MNILCPEDLAPWCRTTTRRNGPVLRDAQGSVISHESRYRIVGLKFYGADRMTAEIEIPFLIGPVKQPILSLGKLVAGLNAQLKIGAEGGDVLQLDGMTFKVTRMLQSYYIPCYPMAPEDDYWVQQIGTTKMMTIGDGVVKYKQRMRVEPSKIQLEEAKPEKAASARQVPVWQEREPRALPKALAKKSCDTSVKQEKTKSPKESKETRSPKESTETRWQKESKEAKM